MPFKVSLSQSCLALPFTVQYLVLHKAGGGSDSSAHVSTRTKKTQHRLRLSSSVVGGCFGWNGFYLYEVREVIIYN